MVGRHFALLKCVLSKNAKRINTGTTRHNRVYLSFIASLFPILKAFNNTLLRTDKGRLINQFIRHGIDRLPSQGLSADLDMLDRARKARYGKDRRHRRYARETIVGRQRAK